PEAALLSELLAILLVSAPLFVFRRDADAEFRLSTTRIDFDDLRVEAHAGRELLPEIRPARGARVPRRNEAARGAPGHAEQAHDDAGGLAANHLHLDDRVLGRLLLRLFRLCADERGVQRDLSVPIVVAVDHDVDGVAGFHELARMFDPFRREIGD